MTPKTLRAILLDIEGTTTPISFVHQVLFANSEAGDLTKFISSYFDTKVGKKTEAESYRQISATLSVAANEIHFISDVTTELDAAQNAGMKTSLCVRPGNVAQELSFRHKTIQSFNEIGDE